jgi:uncharacterized protein YfaA (DUF2138 family)
MGQFMTDIDIRDTLVGDLTFCLKNFRAHARQEDDLLGVEELLRRKHGKRARGITEKLLHRLMDEVASNTLWAGVPRARSTVSAE